MYPARVVNLIKKDNYDSLTIAGSGHRPKKLVVDGKQAYLGTYAYSRLLACAVYALKLYSPTQVISGFALGWDFAIADAAISLKIPLIAAIPFEGHESEFDTAHQKHYNTLLEQAEEVEITSEGNFSKEKFQIRNEWMADNSQVTLAMWDGKPSGTANYIHYATSIGNYVINLWDFWEEHKNKHK